jgi:DNA-directed RNA polymerase subunit RPC12/RpoP
MNSLSGPRNPRSINFITGVFPVPMPAATPFKKSRLSWFRCPYCNAATYSAISHTIFSKEHPRVAVEYQCEKCGRFSTLRNPGVMQVGVPLVLAVCTIVAAYTLPLQTTPWYSLAAIAMLAALTVAEMVVSLAIARIAKRFDPL